MSEDREILAAAAALVESGAPFVLVTVVRAQGSTPRDAGAKMIWRPGPDAAVGTVGGGQFELLVQDAASRCFEARSNTIEKFVLGADADQCCGGVMEVFLEYHGPRGRLVVFGAGHVSQRLVELMECAPLELVVADDRPEWNSPERFPRARRLRNWDEAVELVLEAPARTMACVMTCSHDTDFELLRRLLARPPAYLGLIGSRSKRACLFGRLVASGIDDDIVKRVHCPIGVGDTGKEPRQVAISMAAQLLMEARRLAPR